MAFFADLATLALLAGLALVHDPDSLDPLSPRLPLAALLIPAGLLAAALTRRALAFHQGDALAAAALALTSLGAALSPAPWDSGPALAAAALAAGAYLLGRRAGERPALLEAAASGTLIALIAVSATMIGSYAQPAGRDLLTAIPTHALVGPLANPDLTAAWIVLVLPLAAAGRGGRVLTGLGIIALAWTLSRGALLAAAGAACLYHARALPTTRRPVVAALIAFLVLTGFAAVNPTDRAKLTSPTTVLKRLTIWRTSLDLYRQSPLFGHGPGRFGALYANARPADPTGPGRLPPSSFAHNLPLQVAVEHGLAGLALLSLAVAGLARLDPHDPQTRALAAGLAGFLLHNLVSHAAYTLPILLLAAFLAGALVTRAPHGPVESPRAYALTCLLAGFVLFLIAPWTLSANRAFHAAGVARALLARANPEASALAAKQALAALAEAPNHPHVRYIAAGALAESGRPAAALAQYLLLEAQTHHFGHETYDRGRVVLDLDRPHVALPSIDAALALDPDFFPAWYAKAEAHYMLKDRPKSQAALDRARALAPTSDWVRRLDDLARALR